MSEPILESSHDATMKQLEAELARVSTRIAWRGSERLRDRVGDEVIATRKSDFDKADGIAREGRELTQTPLDKEIRRQPLTPLDRDLLLTIAAIRLDPNSADLAAALHEDPTATGATLEFLEALWAEDLSTRVAIRERLAPSAPLRQSGLVGVDRSQINPTRLQFHLSPRGMNLLLARDPGDETPEATPETRKSPTIPDRSLHDLLLDDDTRKQLDEILAAARCREHVLNDWGFAARYRRGLALSALFDGEPGTGKTLAAEILSSELQLPLQRVNVAQVMDKYVGGTEKNLQRIFQEASRSPRVLLFDEADALFASRVQVESSQDRHANLEINVLLQLMEEFDGVVVLTTNLPQGIDKAFERRIGYKIHFAFPDPSLRARLWNTLIPDEAPIADEIDYADLAERFELSGGSIRNAILRAAYACAARNEPLDSSALEEAAERECTAAGKLYQPRNKTRERFGL